MKKMQLVSLGGCLVFLLLLFVVAASHSESHSSSVEQMHSAADREALERDTQQVPLMQRFPGLNTNTNKYNIDLDEIMSGGPGKDGIPALHSPRFITVEEAQSQYVGQLDDVMGVFVEFDGVQRFYPYTILVWHEIVNDRVGSQDIAVTFCPLCGSAIVYDRKVDGKVLDFGVSGLLWESNLLMYDKQSESLWSQSAGRAVAGEYADTELDVLRMQLIDFDTLQSQFPEALVLSEETGFSRDYAVYPYGNYEESDRLYFLVSVDDQRYFSKEIMYATEVDGVHVAIPLKTIDQGVMEGFEVAGKQLKIVKKGFEIEVFADDELVAGYYEMWFSWATTHQKDGLVWDVSIK